MDTLETCKPWEEKDENGNEISRDYIVNHFSKIRISIWPQAKNANKIYMLRRREYGNR